MSKGPTPSIWQNLGAMIGNIAAGISADPKNPPQRLRDDAVGSAAGAHAGIPAMQGLPPQPGPAPVPPATGQVVSARVQEAVVPTPQGPVRLRRTVIDEVVPESGDGR